jgi:Protein of unknown function (DUF3313)
MIRASLLMVLFALFSGSVSAASPSGELSYDGLQRRDSKVFEHLWVRKYFDVRSYHQIIFKSPHIEYRPVMKDSGEPGADSGGFPLTQRQKDSLHDILDAAFRSELAKSKSFKLTTEPGPDVLIIRGDLLDVVSFVPPSESGKGELLKIADIGEATLVMELYDSLSDSIMVRAIERVSATHDANAPPTTAAEAVQRTATRWASLLRERLDAAADIPLEQ